MNEHLATITLYTKTPSRNQPTLEEQVGHVDRVSWSIGVGFGCISLAVYTIKGVTDWKVYIVAGLVTVAIALLIRGVFIWHMATIYAGLAVEEEEVKEFAQPREIPSNGGVVRMRSNIPVTLVYGRKSITLQRSLLSSMERLYVERMDSNSQHIARDHIEIGTGDYPLLIEVLEGKGYLVNNRYTQAGVYWLVRGSYATSPTLNVD
jgi:hypothetical protein